MSGPEKPYEPTAFDDYSPLEHAALDAGAIEAGGDPDIR